MGKQYSLDELIESMEFRIKSIIKIHEHFGTLIDDEAEEEIEKCKQISEQLFRLKQLEK